jgi:GTP pyrophosphokinase
MNALFQKYLDYIKLNESESGSVELFVRATALYETSNSKNYICPKRTKEDCLLSLLDLLMDEFNTYSSTLIAAVLSQSISSLQALKQCKEDFPPHIINIVEAFLNIRKLKFGDIAGQADESRSLILSVAQDMRAVLIDFAIQIIRLRNTEDLGQMAMEPLVYDLMQHIYIPIAHRLGFYQLKSELEDRVLKYRHPKVYRSIEEKLEAGAAAREKLMAEFLLPLKEALDEHKLKYVVKSRTKSISSIWTKMQKQDIPFEKVFDLWAIRIIIDSEVKQEKADCWHVYSVLTNIYTPNLSRLRDWITVPKETGYESLHATVQAANGHWVEVQIRTQRMDDEAENGMAAHWRYKGGKSGRGIDFWLQNIRQVLEKEGDDARQGYLLSSKKFSNEVYVFTPAGHVKKLRLGSTVLDFAFAIHSDIGSTFASAKVNGKIVQIDHVLKNGDQVSIQSSKNNRPSLDWLKIVVDPRTKTKIKHVLDEKRQHEVMKGKEIVERRFKNWKMELNQEVIDSLVKHYKLKKTSDLFYFIATEKLDILNIKKFLQEDKAEVEELNSRFHEDISDDFDTGMESDDILIIDKLNNVNYNLAKCCNPIPGDAIFGFVTVSKGISIHRKDCPNATQMRQRFPYRIIESKWKTQSNPKNFSVNLLLEGVDEHGLITKITQMISNEMGINILKMDFNSDGQKFKGSLRLKVFDISILETLMQELRQIKGIEAVYR